MKPEVEFSNSNHIICYEYKMFLNETGNPSSLTWLVDNNIIISFWSVL